MITFETSSKIGMVYEWIFNLRIIDTYCNKTCKTFHQNIKGINYMYQTRPKHWLAKQSLHVYLHVLKNPLRIQINTKWHFNFVLNFSTNEVHGDTNIAARRRFWRGYILEDLVEIWTKIFNTVNLKRFILFWNVVIFFKQSIFNRKLNVCP